MVKTGKIKSTKVGSLIFHGVPPEVVNFWKKHWRESKNLTFDSMAGSIINVPGEEIKNERMQGLAETPNLDKNYVSQDQSIEIVPPTFVNQVSLRIICDLISESLKTLIINSTKNSIQDNGILQVIANFGNSEFGEAVLSVLLGLGLPQAKNLNMLDPTLVDNLSHEFLVQSGAKSGKFVVEKLVQYFIPILLESLKSMENQQIEQINEENSESVNVA